MNKKASIQLSVNFLVVMIICIVLLGIGIKLISDFSTGATTAKENVDEYHKRMLSKELTRGSLVASYPNSVTVRRGKYSDFGVGVSNELGETKNFSIFVEEDSYNPLNTEEIKLLYLPGPKTIKNNMQDFFNVRIIVPKETQRGSYIFNAYVCKTDDCEYRTDLTSYGTMQKLQVDVE